MSKAPMPEAQQPLANLLDAESEKDSKTHRLFQQVRFILEVDQLKTVLRRTLLIDQSRYENSAEHSWHICMLAMALHEHAGEPEIDLIRVLRMLLVHDIVEIDAGDTYAYDTVGNLDKEEREAKASERIFGLLPEDQKAEFQALFAEFEARETREARFANALDRFSPMLHNYLTEGKSWREHGVKRSQIEARNHEVIQQGAPVLWDLCERFIEDAIERSWLGYTPSHGEARNG